MSKSNAISFMAYLKILEDEILDYSFLGLRINFKGLWSDFDRIFLPNKNWWTPFLLHTISKASFSIFKLSSADFNLQEKNIIGLS